MKASEYLIFLSCWFLNGYVLDHMFHSVWKRMPEEWEEQNETNNKSKTHKCDVDWLLIHKAKKADDAKTLGTN